MDSRTSVEMAPGGPNQKVLKRLNPQGLVRTNRTLGEGSKWNRSKPSGFYLGDNWLDCAGDAGAGGHGVAARFGVDVAHLETVTRIPRIGLAHLF